MKKTSIFSTAGTFAFAAVALGLCVFNTSSNQLHTADSNLKLVNIKAAQANSYEVNCDGTNAQTCTIRAADGSSGTGHGNAIRIELP